MIGVTGYAVRICIIRPRAFVRTGPVSAIMRGILAAEDREGYDDAKQSGLVLRTTPASETLSTTILIIGNRIWQIMRGERFTQSINLRFAFSVKPTYNETCH